MTGIKTFNQIVEEEINKAKFILNKIPNNEIQLGVIQGLRRLQEKANLEAVKWVKEMNQTEKEGLNLAKPQTYFEYFLNLTEEDLK